jgi:threonine aldolase
VEEGTVVAASPEVRARIERSLETNRIKTAEDYMKEIPRDIERDVYGEGGVVGELEGEVAKMLGKPAAVFLPTGTMGQQIALRVHADRRNSRTVLWHPFCHLADNEADGYRRLHGLHGKAVGEPSRLLTINDLEKVAERPAALLLVLPQRDLGGQLPAWHDLVAQVDWGLFVMKRGVVPC